MIGQTISHYRITERLGGGGMGVVYAAEDANLGRLVAIKFLPSDLFDDQEAVERFRREARAASALNHPHICTIYDLGEHEGAPFLAMELMEGLSLRERLTRQPLSTEEALRLGDQIADALAAAHTKGIVHRDIKPENLFVTDRGDAKVLDFGLAKELISDEEDETLTQLTKEGSTVGTPAYMSPEQIWGNPVSARSDIFSLGVVLYEMLSGTHPFRKSQPMQTVDAILHDDPLPLPRVAPGVSESTLLLIRRMLAKDPNERHQNLDEVRAALRGDDPPPTTGSVLVRPPHGRGKGLGRLARIVAGLFIVATIVGLGLWKRQAEPTQARTSVARPSETSTAALLGEIDPNSIAVMPFRNLSPEFYGKALAEDPELALAYAARSRAYERRAAMFGYPREWFDAAVDDARRAVELDSELPETHNALGRALFSRGRLEESLEVLLRAVELDPNNNGAANSLGWIYSEMGQPDEALRWYKRAVELNPAEAILYAIVGLGYIDLGMNEAADRWLDRALELEPDGVGVRNIRAVKLLNTERFEEVAAVGEEILAISPDEPIGLTIAGMGYHFGGDPERAEPYYRRNIDGTWSWSHIRTALARILWNRGEREEALGVLAPLVERLEQEIAEGSTLWWTFYGLAQAAAIQGEKEKAYGLLEKAVDAGATSYVAYRNDPCMGEMRDEERFRELMAEIEGRIDQMRFRVEARERGR